MRASFLMIMTLIAALWSCSPAALASDSAASVGIVTMQWSQEHEGEIEVRIRGDQATVFEQQKERGWVCDAWVDWGQFDESIIRAELGKMDRVKAFFKPSLKEQKKEEAVEAAREEYRAAHAQVQCKISFVPVTQPLGFWEREIQRGITRVVNFQAYEPVRSTGSQTSFRGFGPFLFLLSALADPEDFDYDGFRVKDAKGHEVFHCMTSPQFRDFPCSH